VLVDAGVNTVFTPHFRFLSAESGGSRFELFFGYETPAPAPPATLSPLHTFVDYWMFNVKTVLDPPPAVNKHTQADKDLASHAFSDAFASLTAEKAKGTTLPALQPWIEVCQKSQQIAHEILGDFSMYQWTCE
jgi:hypothetical protein